MSARVRVIVSIVCAASAVALMLAYAASVRGGGHGVARRCPAQVWRRNGEGLRDDARRRAG